MIVVSKKDLINFLEEKLKETDSILFDINSRTDVKYVHKASEAMPIKALKSDKTTITLELLNKIIDIGESDEKSNV